MSQRERLRLAAASSVLASRVYMKYYICETGARCIVGSISVAIVTGSCPYRRKPLIRGSHHNLFFRPIAVIFAIMSTVLIIA